MATGLFRIKQGDLRPYLAAQLVNLTDEGEVSGPQDLTGAVVKFSMRDKTTGAMKITESNAVIIDAVTGLVEYRWQGADTDTPGSFVGEFEATYGGEPITFPNGKVGFDIKIVAQIA